MGAKSDRAAAGSDQLVQKLLPADQRRFAQVESVEIETVEGVIGEPVESSLAEVGLQKRELGYAALVLDHQLAVDQRGARGQLSERFSNAVAELLRPIESAPGPEPNLVLLDMSLKPIAVELDLMQPFVAGRRRLRQRCEHRLNEAGQGSFGCALDRRRIRSLARLGDRTRLSAAAIGFLDLSRLRRPARRFTFQLANGPAGLDRLGLIFEDIGVVGGAGEFIVPLDQKPVLALLARLAAHSDQMPPAFELLTKKLKLKMSLLQAPMRVPDRRPRAFVPHDDRAAAVFAFGDRALEIAVFQRVVFDRDGETLFARNEARAAGHRPALQHAVESEPEIVVQSGRVMLLHDKDIAVREGRRALGLGGRREVALSSIGFERHSLARFASRSCCPCFRCGAPAGLLLARYLAARSASAAGGRAFAQRLQEIDRRFAAGRRA